MKIVMVMAMSADGRIARGERELIDWTSKEDKRHFVGVTKRARVVIVGRKTFETFPKPLPERLNVVMTRNPAAIHTSDEVWPTDRSPLEVTQELTRRGFREAALIGGATVNGLFLEAGLVDEIDLTIEPKLFGMGIPLITSTNVDILLTLASVERLNENTINLRYSVRRN
ncbi:MAG: dihydrofolate reductase [Parcubacteria group bacterium]|nr:dihydrofolate reductase [Parcubacteria group bacterium]